MAGTSTPPSSNLAQAEVTGSRHPTVALATVWPFAGDPRQGAPARTRVRDGR